MSHTSKVKFSVSMPWTHWAGFSVECHPFLTLALDGGEW